MGFVVTSQEEKKQEAGIRGHYRKVAVGCWFTSTGRAIPKMVRYEDDEGIRHIMEHIQVLKTDQKHYAGIRLQRYDCRTTINGIQIDFILLYHPAENLWDMVLPGNC